MPDQISLAKRVGFIPPIPSQGYINLFIGTDGELKMIDSEGNISGAEGAVDVGSITGIEDLEFAEDGLLSGALGDARYATVAQGDLADTAVQSVSAGGGIAVTGTTAATVALTTSAQASLSLANTALQQAGGTVTGNITLNGSENTAPSQVFGANNLLTGSLGDARYGNIIVKTKASDTSRISTTTIGADPDLQFPYTPGIWHVIIHCRILNTGGVGGFRAYCQPNGLFGTHSVIDRLSTSRSDTCPDDTTSLGGLAVYYFADVSFTAASSGTFLLYWAQGASDAHATTLQAGSKLIARKIA